VGPPLGGGEWHGEFRGGAEAFNRTLEEFAQVDADVKRLVVHDGVGSSFWLNPNRQKEKEAEARIDWTFVVWDREGWQRQQNLPASLRAGDAEQKGAEPVPQIDVYTGGNIRWDDVKVPDGIEVVDNRLEAHGFKLEDGTVLEGTVVDLGTQAPLPARARLERIEPQERSGYKYTAAAEAVADDKGHWVIKSVPAGWYRIVVEAEGLVPRIAGYAQLDGQPLWAEYNTGLSRPTTISGRVVDDEDRPLEGVEVGVDGILAEPGGRYDSPVEQKYVTDREGRFVAEALPIGRATVRVHKPGYVRPGLGLDVEMPAKDVVLTMLRSSSIEVTVDFSDTVRPEGYIVQIEDAKGPVVGSWGGTANIDADGKVKFENVPPGRYVLTGRPNPGADAQETDPTPIDLGPGEEWAATLKAK
jgi:hypothetical protein